jgi:zinc protease
MGGEVNARARGIRLGAGAAVVAAVVAAGWHQARPLGASNAAPPADTLASMYDVGGITVIHRRSPTSDIVAGSIFLLGGSRQVNENNAGVEMVMLMASDYGTKSFPGGATRDAISRAGSQVSVLPSADWIAIEFTGLAQDFDSTWAVVADRLVNPTLDSAGVATAKRRLLSTLGSRRDTPANVARMLAESLAYVGHPYQNPTSGTIASVEKLTPDVVRAYHKSSMMTSRIVLVVAGNVTRPQLEAAVQRTLGTLPKGDYKWTMPEKWQPKAPAVLLRRQQSTTNYIVGIFGGPLASTNEVPAFAYGLSGIGSFVYGPMRDSGLTYSAGAGLVEQGASGGVIYATTPDPQRAFKIINNAIDVVLFRASISPSAIAQEMLAQSLVYAARTETNEGQVEALSTSYLYHGDFRYGENFANILRQTSPSDVSRAVRAYVKNIQWAFIGDTARAPRELMMKY